MWFTLRTLYINVSALQRRAAQSVDTTFRISQKWRIRKQSMYLDSDPDRYQNLTICSLAHYQSSLKISCKSDGKILCKVANRRTDKQRRKHNVVGEGNNLILSTHECKVSVPNSWTDSVMLLMPYHHNSASKHQAMPQPRCPAGRHGNLNLSTPNFWMQYDHLFIKNDYVCDNAVQWSRRAD